MKILIIQECGRHEKNREFREALCLKRSLHRLGQEAEVWGLGYDNFSISFEEISKDYDVVLSLENYDTGWHPNISSFKGLKAFWSIDSHCVLHDHVNFCRRNNIDLLLNSTERYIPYFQNSIKYAAWFPNGYPDDLIGPRPNIPRSHDIGFVGSSIAERNAILDQIEKSFSLKRDIFVIGEDMVEALSSYHIGFNFNIRDDINFRTFETTGAGTALLTNYTPGLEKLFDIGREIMIYESLDDLIKKIENSLQDKDQLYKIARAGFFKSKNYHSYDARSRTLVDILKQVSNR